MGVAKADTRGSFSIQDTFLNYARKESVNLLFILVNGSHLQGMVKGFDNFTILVETQGKPQVVYKHAIVSILPLTPVPDIWAQVQALAGEHTTKP